MTVDPPRYRLVDVEVDALTINDLNCIIKSTIEGQEQRIIAHHNLHSIYLYHRTPKMRALYRRADYVHIDGMSLIFLGHLLGLPLMNAHRVTYVDWIRPLLRTAAAEQWKLFYLGARPQVVATGAERIRNRHPNLELEYHHGYFDRSPNGEENRSVVATVNQFDPDVLMVGMGMPRQEAWIAENIDRIGAHVILPSGACMDYVAGVRSMPPRWVGRLGLEWLYRFSEEPSRLWHRNLIEPWPILLRFLKECMRRHLFDTGSQ